MMRKSDPVLRECLTFMLKQRTDRELGILGSVLVQAEAIMKEEFYWLL